MTDIERVVEYLERLDAEVNSRKWVLVSASERIAATLPLLIPLLRAAQDGARAMHDAHIQVEDEHDDISRCVCLLSGPYRQLRVAIAAFSTVIPEEE